MIPLLKHYLLAFFFDENFAKRLLLGIVGFAISVGVTVGVFGVPVVLAWTRQEAISHVALAAITGLAAMLPGPALHKPEPAP